MSEMIRVQRSSILYWVLASKQSENSDIVGSFDGKNDGSWCLGWVIEIDGRKSIRDGETTYIPKVHQHVWIIAVDAA